MMQDREGPWGSAHDVDNGLFLELKFEPHFVNDACAYCDNKHIA